MSFPTIKSPIEHNQVIMEIMLSQDLDPTKIARIIRCHVYLEALFLSDITTADGKYLENFLFNPGGKHEALAVQVLKRATITSGLGLMDQRLARLHNHGRETQNPYGEMNKPNSSNMALVFQQGTG
jgi:hypothetical protein